MKKFQPKKFYDLPQKIFFGVYIATTILALLAIAALWIGVVNNLLELTMTFNAFVVSITLALTLMSSFNSEKKKRISACLYCNFMIVLVVSWVLILIQNEKAEISGAAIGTIMFASIAGLSVFMLVHKKKNKPQPTFVPEGQQKSNQSKPSEEKEVENKIEKTKPVEESIMVLRKVEEKPNESIFIPVETKQAETKEKIDIIQVNLE